MRKLAYLLVAAAVGALALVAAVVSSGPEASTASSHREAPLISEDPTVDNTDLYAFRSPDKPDTLTIISNFIPAQDPAAGPMYYTFSSNARYNIFIDRNGDGRQTGNDITYRFQFKRTLGPLFLRNTAQPYTVTRTTNGRTTVVARGTTPPNNIGPRSTPNYRSIAAKAVRPLAGGGQVFAGQRDDAFFGDIGAIFDLLAIRKGTGSTGGGKDFFAGYAVHTISLQIPISQVRTPSNTIGIWSSAERRSLTVAGTATGRGPWTQVSRIGNPLVNELIIPTTLKDRWNRNTPASEANFRSFYTNPILAKVINQLYKLGAPETGRDDLVQVLLTGIPKVTATSSGKLTDELRINLAVPVTPLAQQDRLGVLGGDNQGWPNGRRLNDDVIDIAEQAVGGFLKGKKLPLGDGVNADDAGGLGFFPYAGDPADGFTNTKGEPTP
jgi:hypothetical protein